MMTARETPDERAGKDGKLSLVAGLVLVTVVMAFVVGWLVGSGPRVDCPTEDSCTVTYTAEDGWIVTEVIP